MVGYCATLASTILALRYPDFLGFSHIKFEEEGPVPEAPTGQ
jgi:hypothetical protein